MFQLTFQYIYKFTSFSFVVRLLQRFLVRQVNIPQFKDFSVELVQVEQEQSLIYFLEVSELIVNDVVNKGLLLQLFWLNMVTTVTFNGVNTFLHYNYNIT